MTPEDLSPAECDAPGSQKWPLGKYKTTSVSFSVPGKACPYKNLNTEHAYVYASHLYASHLYASQLYATHLR